MKSNAPWSVKGIERDARETAKEAARREGMTVGEWLSQVIYTAGDPESSDGEIEGIKISDIVKAIEHLNKRVITAEGKSAAAMEALARNFGGVVERVQRLERGRPTAGTPAGDFEDRLARLEEKSGERQRIDALKALEKAVGQVALQFDAAQKSSVARIETTERQLQELASRLDRAGEIGGAGALGAIDHLKDAIDGMSARLARAERIASEASQLRAEAAQTVDADFVERTGARLRVLGDEIKRGGDQIRSLETLVRKLSEQIDAAEKRSSDGVQKVSETIAELRASFTAGEAPESARSEIETALAAARRTEDRLAELQRAFDDMAARLKDGAPPAAGDDIEAEAVDADEPAAPDAEAVFEEHGVEEDDALAAIAEPEEDDEGLFDFGADADDESDAAATEDHEDEPQAEYVFDLEDIADDNRDYAAAILSEVEGAFSAPRRTAQPAAPAHGGGDRDGIGAILDELEAGPGAVAPRETSEPIVAKPIAGGDILRAARQAARSGAKPEPADSPRQLSPRQRAILAAKLRRKKLAEQGLSLEQAEKRAATPTAPLSAATPFASAAASVGAPESAASNAQDDAEEKNGPGRLIASLARALPFGGRGGKKETATEADERGKARAQTGRAHADDDDDFATPEPEPADRNPNLAAGAAKLFASLRAKPVTLALAAAILLAVVALGFLVKDLLSGDPRRSAVSDAPQLTAAAPEVPAPPAVQPRALYRDAVARLKTAGNDAEMRSAIDMLTQAATLGHPPAQLQLGELYKLGQGVEQDQAQARGWYERAATGGNVLAMHRAGVMAARGQGGAADLEAAINWFERASRLGLVDSQYNLGAIFYPTAEKSPHQNAGQAYFWYSLAGRNGDTQATSLAAGLARSLSGEERRRLDEAVSSWSAQTPDPDANDIAPAT